MKPPGEAARLPNACQSRASVALMIFCTLDSSSSDKGFSLNAERGGTWVSLDAERGGTWVPEVFKALLGCCACVSKVFESLGCCASIVSGIGCIVGPMAAAWGLDTKNCKDDPGA